MSALLNQTDTITLRFIMALGSVGSSIVLATFAAPFTKEAYGLMAMCAPQLVWALMFIIYGAGTLLLIYLDVFRGKPRRKANRVMNTYGFMLWGFCLLAVMVAVEYPPPLMVPLYVIIPLMGWAIVKTVPERRVR